MIRTLVVLSTLALAGAGCTANTGVARTTTAPVAPAPGPVETSVASARTADDSEKLEQYQEREQRSAQLEEYRGGDKVVIGVSGGALVIILLLVILL